MTATIREEGSGWAEERVSSKRWTSIRHFIEVDRCGLVWPGRGVGCDASLNSHPRWQNKRNKPEPKHKPDYGTWGVGRGVWARVLRMDFCIYARDAKETFTNEVVIGSCSFAAQPVQLLLFVPPPQLPGLPCCHNKLSDNCTNCQGGNAARDSSTVQRFQLSSTRCPACGLTVDALTD